MDNCLNCGKELIHTEGRRPKKYCDESCKMAHWVKTHKGEPKYVQYKTYRELSEKFNAITKNKYEPNITVPTIEDNEPENIHEIGNSELERQINAIRTEKIPKERDTSLGRKVWNNEQRKKISELESKLK